MKLSENSQIVLEALKGWKKHLATASLIGGGLAAGGGGAYKLGNSVYQAGVSRGKLEQFAKQTKDSDVKREKKMTQAEQK